MTSTNVSENYLLQHINRGKLVISKKDFEEYVIQMAVEEKLVKKLHMNFVSVWGNVLIIMMLFLFPVFLLLWSISNSNAVFMEISIYAIIVMPVIGIILLGINIISWMVFSVKYKRNPGVRTKKGKEINLRLEGLKNFLKDFSALD